MAEAGVRIPPCRRPLSYKRWKESPAIWGPCMDAAVRDLGNNLTWSSCSCRASARPASSSIRLVLQYPGSLLSPT